MKNTWNKAFLFMGMMILGMLVYSTFFKPPEEIKYKYNIAFFTDENCDDGLNKLGGDGWKVVGSRRANNKYEEYGYEFVFEKQIYGEQNESPVR